MMMEITLKQILENDFIIKDDHTVIVIDEELDPFQVDFMGDECATIQTRGMQYIKFSPNTLRGLALLCEKSEKKYKDSKSI